MMANTSSLLKWVDNLVGPILCRTLGWLHFKLNPDHYPSPIDTRAIRHVLLIRPGGMGDMVNLLPMLHQLQHLLPHARLTIVCERRNRAILALMNITAEVLVYDSFRPTFLSTLVRGQFDLVIDTEQFHHFSAIFSLMSRAPIRIGFNINPRRNALYTHLVPYSPDDSETRQFARLIQPLFPASTDARLQGVMAGLVTDIPADYSHLRLSRYVAIHAGSSSPYKHWEADKFVDLCMHLSQEMHIHPVLVGGRQDLAVSEPILHRLTARGITVTSTVGRVSIEETTAVLQHAAAFVGLDSGLAHIAVALNRPTVVLFGPTDPRKWGTDSGQHKVISRSVPCSPCALFGYFRPCTTFACMRLISSDDVLAALRKVL